MPDVCNNPGFESDTAHWFTTGATITRTIAEQHTDLASASIATTGSAQNQGAINDVTQAVTVGVPLTASMWAKGSGKVKVWASTVDGVYQDVFKSAEVTLTSTWQLIVATGTTTLTATSVRAECRTSDDVAAQAVTFYIDDVELFYGTSITVPTAPLSLQATAGDNQVALNWSAPSSDGGAAITAYQVYRSTSANNELLYASPGLVTSYTDSAATNGVTYYYRVSASNSVGIGPWGNEVSASPVAPPTVFQNTLKRFYGPALLGNSAATLYTCPAGATAVIRHIHVSNPTGSAVDFTLSIGASAAGTRLWDAQPIPADDFIDHLSEHILVAGEILQAFGGSAGVLNLTVDGYEVAATPVVPSDVFPSESLFPSD